MELVHSMPSSSLQSTQVEWNFSHPWHLTPDTHSLFLWLHFQLESFPIMIHVITIDV